nr:hypothetical protein CFP56_14448 [Quercus suber]
MLVEPTVVFPALPHSPSASLSLSSLPHPLRSVVDASVDPSLYPPPLIIDMQALNRVKPRPDDDTQWTQIIGQLRFGGTPLTRWSGLKSIAKHAKHVLAAYQTSLSTLRAGMKARGLNF